ncbi:MAG: ATP-binding cassette domain-containing protein [Phycisphaerae bacterium]
MIDIQAVRHSYGERAALQDVTFAVPAGETFGLLGPNGSGKSTLFKLLTTTLPVQAGTVRVAGVDVMADANAVRRRIGVVFQHPALDPFLTVRENLKHHGHLYGMTGADLAERIEARLKDLAVADRAGEYVKSLSGGLRRRVEIAKAPLPEPAILLMDEPSTGLDPNARRELWSLLAGLVQSRGLSVFASTHLMDEAERFDRVALLDGGRVVACGTPEELKRQVGRQVLRLHAGDSSSLREILSDAPEAAVRGENGRLVVDGLVPEAVLSRLMQARRPDDAISVGPPTMDDVFERMTGRPFEPTA